jgi:hypothetical protein
MRESGLGALGLLTLNCARKKSIQSTTIRKLLEEATLPKEMVDNFLNPEIPNWAQFDSELGYTLKNSVMKDGIDDSYTLAHYEPTGERRMLNYADQPCRINTYGNSFTQCQQVSDGETWQEYLAAHMGEPIRNFGIGGYGVYQAYRRMLREEKTESTAEYIVLNIYSDDHVRSNYSCRWLFIPWFWRRVPRDGILDHGVGVFNANPWAHIRLNLETGKFEEQKNAYTIPNSLYQLCDKEHVVKTFSNDFVFQAYAATQFASDVKLKMLHRGAEILNVSVDFTSLESTGKTAKKLLRMCSLKASMAIVEKARSFAKHMEKKLMIMLCYSQGDVISACENRNRFDQIFVDYIQESNFTFVDTLQKHKENYRLFACSPEEYVKQYYIDHHNPLGNHFFAFAIKDDIVNWLDPMPPTYIGDGRSIRELGSLLA